MKILLFCENKYAIDILRPIHDEAILEGGNDILWFIDQRKITDFPYKDEVRYTNSIQECYDYHPDAVFVPGNIVPYYLSGVKIQVFHGYAAEKKDHWVIRRYFDTYFTQGPFFTGPFKKLSQKYGDFEVLETGWPRQDWIARHRHDYDQQRQQLLNEHGKERIVLYAPTFSPSLTSLGDMKEALRTLVRQNKDTLVIMKFHPLTSQHHLDNYRQLAAEEKDILFIDDFTVTKYMLMADAMISDTSSTIYEFLLLNKPVITLRAVAKDLYWQNCDTPEEIPTAYRAAITDDPALEKRQWIIRNYDPYTDGKVAHRMLEGARDYIRRHGVPRFRKLNIWRKYTSIKTFGRVKK